MRERFVLFWSAAPYACDVEASVEVGGPRSGACCVLERVRGDGQLGDAWLAARWLEPLPASGLMAVKLAAET